MFIFMARLFCKKKLPDPVSLHTEAKISDIMDRHLEFRLEIHIVPVKCKLVCDLFNLF